MTKELCESIVENKEMYDLADLNMAMQQRHVESDMSKWFVETTKMLDDPSDKNRPRKRQIDVFEQQEGGFKSALEVGGEIGEQPEKKRVKVSASTKEEDGDQEAESAL